MISAEEDLSFRTYSPVRNYPYDRWFHKLEYNGKTLNEEEKKEYVAIIDRTIVTFTSGLPLLTQELKRLRNQRDEYSSICSTTYSVLLFVLVTMCDCMVASKFFILADKDYDKRFMRGKMKVILNEGFKKLYGYIKENKEKSQWNSLLKHMKSFPEDINHQYRELTYQLENQSKLSSWWKDERDYETHIDAEHLYDSRMVEIEESKEMMETTHLFSVLFAVHQFLTNLTACLRNFLVWKYRRGELKEE